MRADSHVCALTIGLPRSRMDAICNLPFAQSREKRGSSWGIFIIFGKSDSARSAELSSCGLTCRWGVGLRILSTYFQNIMLIWRLSKFSASSKCWLAHSKSISNVCSERRLLTNPSLIGEVFSNESLINTSFTMLSSTANLSQIFLLSLFAVNFRRYIAKYMSSSWKYPSGL